MEVGYASPAGKAALTFTWTVVAANRYPAHYRSNFHQAENLTAGRLVRLLENAAGNEHAAVDWQYLSSHLFRTEHEPEDGVGDVFGGAHTAER